MRGNAAARKTPLFVLLLAATALVRADVSRAAAPTVLNAVDNAELRAEIAQTGPVRVALLGDRIERVVQAPGGWTIEHDADAGDIYIQSAAQYPQPAETVEPAGIFVGSERGFTYRLDLLPVLGGASQLLIRNPAAGNAQNPATGAAGDAHVAGIADLIRAVANRNHLPGYVVERWARETEPDAAAGHSPFLENGAVLPKSAAVIEVWRGARYEALALALGADVAPIDAAELADHFGPKTLAAWIDGAGTSETRLAVIVRGGAGHVGR